MDGIFFATAVIAKTEIILLSDSLQGQMLMEDSTKSFATSLPEDPMTRTLDLLQRSTQNKYVECKHKESITKRCSNQADKRHFE
jgi:hypothetical protein